MFEEMRTTKTNAEPASFQFFFQGGDKLRTLFQLPKVSSSYTPTNRDIRLIENRRGSEPQYKLVRCPFRLLPPMITTWQKLGSSWRLYPGGDQQRTDNPRTPIYIIYIPFVLYPINLLALSFLR